jgi:hypothetical protein
VGDQYDNDPSILGRFTVDVIEARGLLAGDYGNLIKSCESDIHSKEELAIHMHTLN